MRKFLVVLAVFAIGGLAASFWGVEDTGTQYLAKHECKTSISNQLKAPATADFDITTSGDGPSWEVIATVDSENGFGAKLRSMWTCKVTYAGGIYTATPVRVS